MKDSYGNKLPEFIDPSARWSDCQGKKDFDGWLVSISTRYWPGYGSRPSAHSSINLLFGDADDDGYNADYFMLTEKTFEGDTEADVKRQVEVWVHDRANDVKDALVKLFRCG